MPDIDSGKVTHPTGKDWHSKPIFSLPTATSSTHNRLTFHQAIKERESRHCQPEECLPEIGQTISHFMLVEKIGGGGMGEIYLTDERFRRYYHQKIKQPKQ